MKNNFIENINDEKYFYSLIEDIENSKVGFYSVGLWGKEMTKSVSS